MSDNSSSRRVILGALLSLAPLKAAAQIQLPREASDFLNRKGITGTGAASLPSGATLSQNQIGAGLKEAMKVASRRVIGQVGRPDGFFRDPASAFRFPARWNASLSRCARWAPAACWTIWCCG